MSDIYITTDLDIDGFAIELRRILNIPPTNVSRGKIDQQREAMNYGGVYYLFEVLGLELALVRNAGETAVVEFPDASLYIVVRGETRETDTAVARQVAAVLTRSGFPAEVDVQPVSLRQH